MARSAFHFQRNSIIWLGLLAAIPGCRTDTPDLTVSTSTSEAPKIEEIGPDASHLPDGVHAVIWNGDSTFIQVQNGGKEGYSKSFYRNGTLHRQGAFHHDTADGWWETFDRHGVLTAAGIYRKGQRQGTWRLAGASLQQEARLFGVMAILSTTSADLLAAEGAYVQGIPHGPWRFYNKDDGLRAEGHLHLGAMTGWWRIMDEAGTVIREGEYTANVPDGTQHLFEAGMLREAGTMINGKRVGTWTRYNDQGAAVRLEDWD